MILRNLGVFRAAYRNLTHDLSTVWSLGEARDILGSKVMIDKHARTYSPKLEQPRYKNSHSPFKSPILKIGHTGLDDPPGLPSLR
jgi:hypothetical protein